jgi:hypothetical protein
MLSLKTNVNVSKARTQEKSKKDLERILFLHLKWRCQKEKDQEPDA